MNTLSIETIRDVPLGELSSLEVKTLFSLIQDADANLKKAKQIKDWLDGALKLKYEEFAHGMREFQEKDTGTVSFNDEDFKVSAHLPKKVSWDQEKLKAIVKAMRDKGNNPEKYIDISYRVSERSFFSCPFYLFDDFEAARTVSVGKETFKLETLPEDLS